MIYNYNLLIDRLVIACINSKRNSLSVSVTLQEAVTFWEQQLLAAQEHAAKTILPTCTAVVNISNNSKDLIERELSSFYQSLDNSLYMLPATPQVCYRLASFLSVKVQCNKYYFHAFKATKTPFKFVWVMKNSKSIWLINFSTRRECSFLSLNHGGYLNI